MQQALCLQHVPFEGPGFFCQALTTRHYELHCCVVPQEGLPKHQPDFLLVMGGPMSVNDSDPWIGRELQFIRQAIERGIPTLGVCLGSQFIAKAIGGHVKPGPVLELGPVPITLTSEGRGDPVFSAFPDNLDVFQWHGEGITLPSTAIPLASSEKYPIQAFRYGHQTYGLLFHPELEPEGVEALCRECANDVRKAGTTAKVLLASAFPIFPHSHELADRMIAHLTGTARPNRTRK